MRRIIGICAMLVCLCGLAGSTGVVSAGAQSKERARFTVRFIERTDVSGVPFTAAVATFVDNTPELVTGPLVAPTAPGDTIIKLGTHNCRSAKSPATVGLGGPHPEQVVFDSIGTEGAGGTGITVSPALKFAHAAGETVSSPACAYDYSATIDWGDGTAPSAGTIDGGPTSPGGPSLFTITGTHTYLSPGKFSPSVTIKPEDGPASVNPLVGAGKQTVKLHGGSSNPKTIRPVVGVPFDGAVASFTDPFHDGMTAQTSDPTIVGALKFRIWGRTDCITSDEPLFLDVSGPHPEHVVVVATGPFDAATGTSELTITPALQFAHAAGSNIEAPSCAYDYDASINWGDGKPPSAGTVVGGPPAPGERPVFTVGGTHTYAAPGTFVVTVTITEDGSLPFALSPPSSAVVSPDNLYAVTPIWSNIPGVGKLDTNLVNPWGLTSTTTSPWWAADNGSNKSTLYNTATNAPNTTVVTVDGGPTGTVATGVANQFLVATTAAPTTLGTSNFVFASQDGKIRAWRGGSTAGLVTADRSAVGASYFGLAFAGTGAAARIYAADLHNKRIDVFDGGWNLATPVGAFVDPSLPAGYSPFGIQTIQRIGGTRIFVAYAHLDAAGQDEEHGPGLGIVDVYDTAGVFLHRVETGGALNAPWGLTLAPSTFGPFAGDLLVGNFGDGVIQGFREQADGSWDREGVLRDTHGDKLKIDGLWALEFGNASSNGPASTLFYTAGPNDEEDGVFGSITPFVAPPPAG